MLVRALGKYFRTQFPWQLFRYPLALIHVINWGKMNLFLQETLHLMSCGSTQFPLNPLHLMAILKIATIPVLSKFHSGTPSEMLQNNLMMPNFKAVSDAGWITKIHTSPVQLIICGYHFPSAPHFIVLEPFPPLLK